MNILDALKQIKTALPNDTCRQVFDALEQTGIRTIENDNLFDRAVDELRYAAQELSVEIDLPWQEVAIAMMMSLVEDIEDEALSNGADDPVLPQSDSDSPKPKYDHITDQFSSHLSELAKQLYAAIFDACSDPGRPGYVASWNLAEFVPEADGMDSVSPSPGEEAKRELINAGLIQEVSNLGCRYQPTGRAWALHLDAVRQRASI